MGADATLFGMLSASKFTRARDLGSIMAGESRHQGETFDDMN
jgi:hypothetical protein